jgi:signal transduction histidine kinase
MVADERKFKQILYNLLSNGIKFTPSQGEVCLRAKSDNGFLHLSVEDTGIGIKQEDMEGVFTPFAQVDGSYSRQFSGVGLGLSMARELVELHGGRIWAESEGEGKGATFHVVIPSSPPLLTDAAEECPPTTVDCSDP